jgi:ankyrin repeat protein
VNKPNSKGETPVYVCCRRDSKEVLKILIDNRADVNIGCEGEQLLTPLMKCVLLDNMELARIIMKVSNGVSKFVDAKKNLFGFFSPLQKNEKRQPSLATSDLY